MSVFFKTVGLAACISFAANAACLAAPRFLPAGTSKTFSPAATGADAPSGGGKEPSASSTPLDPSKALKKRNAPYLGCMKKHRDDPHRMSNCNLDGTYTIKH